MLYLIKEVTADQTENILQLSKRIRQEIEKINFPIEIMEEISKALTKHGNTIPYTVCSSATDEDLPGASFAGQQDTFLNVTGTEKICNSIIKCWASLFNERAVAYRIKNGFHHKKVTMAVVVQKMVNSKVSESVYRRPNDFRLFYNCY